MDQSELISKLLSKRKRQIDLLGEHRRHIESIKADIAALEATILISDPGFDFLALKQSDRMNLPLFKHGEALRLTLDAFREIGRPALKSEIVDIIANQKGFDENKRRVADYSLRSVFRKGGATGLIEVASKDAAGFTWRIGPSSLIPERKIRFKSGEGLRLVLDALCAIAEPAHMRSAQGLLFFVR